MGLLTGRAIILLLLATFLLHLPALFTYPDYVHDEVYFAGFAGNLARGSGTVFDVHPYLQKDITALSILLLGDNPVGWRLPNMLAHVALVAAVLLLARELFPGRKTPVYAAVLMTMETMTFALGSFAMVDMWAPLFLVLTLVFVMRFLSYEKQRQKNIVLAGLSAGLALASKWPAAIILLVFFVYLVWEGKLFQLKNVRFLLFFLIVSGLVYAATFVPPLLRGQDPVWWHVQALGYHLSLKADHPYFSAAWTWPLSLRPVWFEFASARGVQGVLAIGNPLAFLPMIPAALYIILKRRRESHFFVLSIAVLALWLFFFPVRATTSYNFAPAVPFGVLLLAGLLASAGTRVRRLYLLAAALFFLFFYPLLVGLPIPEWFYQIHIWMRSWI